MNTKAIFAAIVAAVVGGLAWLRKRDEEDEGSIDDLPGKLPPAKVATLKVQKTIPEPDAWDPADLILEEEDEEEVDVLIAPPNISGHSAGYNLDLFPNYPTINKFLRFMGYAAPETNDPAPLSSWKAFQRDANESAETGFLNAKGRLKVDGLGGKHSYNMLELVATGLNGMDPLDITRGSQWKTEHDLWGA